MPNTKQAKKRMRQNVKRKADNRARKSEVKTYTKKVLTAVQNGSLADAEEAFKVLQKKADKAAKGNALRKEIRNIAQDIIKTADAVKEATAF